MLRGTQARVFPGRPPPQLAVAAALVLCLAGPVAAAPVPAPLLLYGPEGPSPALAERAIAAYNLQSSRRGPAPEVRHVGQALAGVPDVALHSDGVLRDCPGTVVGVDAVDRGLADAFQHVLYLQVDQAREVLGRIDGLLPCLSGPLPRETLAQIAFLDGVGLALVGDDAAARDSFRRALVVAPDLEWDPNFPPGAEAVFREAVQALQHTTPATLIVEPGIGQRAEVWVDGMPIPTGGGSCSLAAGRHLLQWRLDPGGFGSQVAEVEGGQRLLVIGREDVALAALSGEGHQVTRGIAADALGALAREGGRDVIHLADLRSADLLHRFDPASGAWKQQDADVAQQRFRRRRLGAAGGVSLAAGSAVAVAGLVLGLTGYASGQALYDELATIRSQDLYDEKARQYQASRGQVAAGAALVALGGTAVVVSIPLLAGSAGGGRRVVTVQLQLGPSGTACSVRF